MVSVHFGYEPISFVRQRLTNILKLTNSLSYYRIKTLQYSFLQLKLYDLIYYYDQILRFFYIIFPKTLERKIENARKIIVRELIRAVQARPQP